MVLDLLGGLASKIVLPEWAWSMVQTSNSKYYLQSNVCFAILTWGWKLIWRVFQVEYYCRSQDFKLGLRKTTYCESTYEILCLS